MMNLKFNNKKLHRFSSFATVQSLNQTKMIAYAQQ